MVKAYRFTFMKMIMTKQRYICYAQAVTDTLESPAVYWLMPGQGQEMALIDAPVEGTTR